MRCHYFLLFTLQFEVEFKKKKEKAEEEEYPDTSAAIVCW